MTTDGLTGVANKRYLMEILDRDWEHAVHEGSSLALLMMDLDKFKSINDTHGHPAGDAVLVEFARRARSVVRSTDLLARFGGEEFSVLMAHADLAEASEVAERIREAVAARPILFEETSIPVTVSIGLAVAHPKGNDRPADLIAQADALLYEAKQAGRNRVCFGPVA
jgi:diguanylate cyclase (GGDEF)-like protein